MTEAEQEKRIMEGILRVAAGNDYTNWKRRHKPNLGPYTLANPRHCEHCGKPGCLWSLDDVCSGGRGTSMEG